MLQRRRFIQIVPAAGFGLLAAKATSAADEADDPFALPIVKESDSHALLVAYVSDWRRVDRVKYPAFQEGQSCANCRAYSGKDVENFGGCALLPGRVAREGWCREYAKKAG
jgi:hypothetical protein